MQRTIVVLLIVAASMLFTPRGAEAYIGPGAGITVIGTVVAFFAALVFAIVGFVWYPIKRLLAALRARKARAEVNQSASPS